MKTEYIAVKCTSCNLKFTAAILPAIGKDRPLDEVIIDYACTNCGKKTLVRDR